MKISALHSLIKLTALVITVASSGTHAMNQEILELHVPYQLNQLDAAVIQAQIRCDVYTQAIAPSYGGLSVANGNASIRILGNAASGSAVVKINVPQHMSVKSYRCGMQLFDGKTWTGATTAGNLSWANAGTGSVLSIKGKVPPRPKLPGIPGEPANPGLLL